jgi:hypothetical protein
MRRSGVLFVAVLFLAIAGPAAAQGVVELIPEEAAAGVFVRNLRELRTKGERFITDAKLDMPLRPSQLFTFAYDYLGVRGVVDEKASAGIVLMTPEGKEEIGFRNLERLIVPIVPFAKRDDVADAFGVDREELKSGKIAPGKARNFGKFFHAGKKHVSLSNDRRTLERVVRGKSVAASLPPGEVERFNKADLIVHLGAEAWKNQWSSLLRREETDLVKDVDAEGAKAIHEFVTALTETRYVTAGVTVEGGLGTHFLATLPEDGTGAKLIERVRSRSGGSNLKGLPDGRVVLAQAHGGEGRANALYARVLFDYLLKETLEARQLIAPTDRPTFAGVFEDLWRRLKGGRFAVYLTPDEHRIGLFSVVAVLDADDAGKFLREMKTLARIADGTKLDLARPEAKDGVDIAKLVRDLGSDDYPTRHAAHVRLGLLGEPAMVYLKKHLDSGDIDLETKRRVERLQEHIGKVAAERRKGLLGKEVVKYLRPRFIFVPEAETRAGTAVDVVQIKLEGDQAAADTSMKQLLGPDWDKLRLAVVGDRVAVLLGSDVSLFDAAVRNLKDDRPGLADAKYLGEFRKQATGVRQMETHFDVEALLGLTAANPPPRRDAPVLTSFALGLGPHDVHLDLFVPGGAVRVVAGKLLGR